MIIYPYAAILALLYCAMSIAVIKTRRSNKTPIGNGENLLLARLIRAHANFGEYTPITLFLAYLVSLTTETPWILHLTLSLFILARITHYLGLVYFERVHNNFLPRVIGMATTFTIIILYSLLLLYYSI